MEKKKIVINPVLLIIIKFMLLPLMIFFSYIKNEGFFLLAFVFCLVIDIALLMAEKNEEIADEILVTNKKISGILFFISLSLCYLFFFRGFIEKIWLLYLIFVLIYIANRAFSYVKFKKFLFFQTTASKILYFSGIIFTIVSMLSGFPSMILSVLLALFSFFTVIEEFLILRRMRHADEIIVSLFKS